MECHSIGDFILLNTLAFFVGFKQTHTAFAERKGLQAQRPLWDQGLYPTVIQLSDLGSRLRTNFFFTERVLEYVINT